MKDNKSIFTNIVYDVEEIEIRNNDTLENSKLEKLKDLVGVKPKDDRTVLPTIHVPDYSGALSRPVSLDHVTNCPRCNNVLKQAISISGAESTSFKECPSCGTLINNFRPIKYQEDYAKRNERYTMLAGGYGSGKSRIHIEQVIKHLILIPRARVVVAAKTFPALEATFVKDFFSIMPVSLLRKKNEQKREWIFSNGSELMLRSFDDETKLRGINATMFVLLEASNIQYAGFELAQNRIRNTAALIPEMLPNGMPKFVWDDKAKMNRPVYKHDARKILIETNPDAGWIKKDFLVDSHEVVYYGSAYREGYRMNSKLDDNKFTLVMATDANPYLPEGFIEEQTRGKSRAYVNQFFYGSFNFSENSVYPNIGGVIVKPHPLPPEIDEHGRRALWYVIGLDYGINDPLAIIYGAYSTITKKLYFFDEIYKRGLDIKTAVARHRSKLKQYNITNDKLLMLPVFDGRSYNKRESDLITIGDLFNNEGLYFRASFTFNDARIARFNGIINEEQIEVYSNLEFFIEEATNYKFKPNRDGSISDKPVDKDNHAINAAEFIIMEMPLNLNYLNVNDFIPIGVRHLHNTAEDNKQNVVKQFNPYEGGQRNDRHFNRNTNNIVGINANNTSNSSNYHASKTSRYSQDEEDDNLFSAYIPRKTS